jgi:hypothetical protein
MAAAGAGAARILTDEERRLRAFDMETALCIASMAGCPTHDGLGNLLPSVWCRHEPDVAHSTSVLLEAADLRKMLLEQLRAHMERRKDLILESEDTEALVQWIMDFSEDWETKFREKQNLKYDISQNIYAAMLETFNYVDTEMQRMEEARWRAWKRRFYENNDPRFFSHERAMVRLLFRKPELNNILCRLACRLLQKKDVCNKSGAYSSKVQRNDVTQQVDDAVYSLQAEIARPDSPFLELIQIRYGTTDCQRLIRDLTQPS